MVNRGGLKVPKLNCNRAVLLLLLLLYRAVLDQCLVVLEYYLVRRVSLDLRLSSTAQGPGGTLSSYTSWRSVRENFRQPKNISLASLQPKKYQLFLYFDT